METMHGTGVTGTFAGRVFPGSLFVASGPVPKGWTYLHFCWNVIALAVADTALRLTVGARTERWRVQ